MVIIASVPWRLPNVFCFDPAMVLFRMEEAFGGHLEYDGNDLFDGHYERIADTATQLGIPLTSSVVQSAARLVRQVSPRYHFRLRVGEGLWVNGKVDRASISVLVEEHETFPEPMRSCFIDFLRSLRPGEVEVDVSDE
jgi:hypothetical protein